VSAPNASCFRRNDNRPLREPSPRVRRYLGIQIFATAVLLGTGGMLVSAAMGSLPEWPSLSLPAGAALAAGGLISLWNLVRPH
jgi:hypothetical protein